MVDKCVIVRESYLSGEETPYGGTKEVLGLSVICRTILTAAKTGISSFVIVDRKNSSIKEHILKNRSIKKENLKVEFLEDFEKGSIETQSPHILVITDNSFFSPEYLKAFTPQKDSITLIQDSDSQKVNAAYIPSSHSQQFINSLKVEINQPFGDLFSNLDIPLKTEQKVVHRGFLIHLDNPDKFRQGFSKLLNSVRKDTDGFVSRYFNRYVSLFCSRIFIFLGLSPNTISFSNFFLGVISAWLIGVGGYQNNVIAALIFQFTSIIDGSDGEVAKLTFNCSPKGAWIDTICDQLTYLVFFIALPIGLYNTFNDPIYIVLGLLTIISIPITYLQMTSYVKKAGGEGSMLLILEDIKESGKEPGLMGSIHRLAASITFIFRRDFFSFGVMLVAFINQLHFIMWGVASLLVIQSIYLFLYSGIRFKKSI